MYCMRIANSILPSVCGVQMILFMDIPVGGSDSFFRSYKIMPRAEVPISLPV